MRRLLLLLVPLAALQAEQPYSDRTHHSDTFGGPRHYRIFLPPAYETSGKRYPAVYYFHGHSDRYTLELYDHGLDTVPKISAFVANHEVIVIAVDGYVARDYTGFYNGTPYDVRREGGDIDFGAYYLELVRHIDSTFRTLSSRRYRATSGLSMGGFMSLYLSARYPDWIGSASSFNPGPEFYVGEKGRRSLWRPKDHVTDHEHTMIRLIRASGDYISQYTEETRAAYASASGVDFEFRQDEYHRHWATSIGETFEFHTRAFGNPALDNAPLEWNYSSAYRSFTVWNYRVEVDSSQPAFLYMEHVGQAGFRIRTRRWAPDGPLASCSAIALTTAPLYQPRAQYRVFDYNLATGKAAHRESMADSEGRLEIHTDCSGHEISFQGAGTDGQPPVLLPVTDKDLLRLPSGRSLALPIRVYNPRSEPLVNVRAELASDFPTVEIIKGKSEIKQILGADAFDLSSAFQVRFTAGAGDFARARLRLRVIYDGYRETKQNIDVLIAPDPLRPPLEVAILDGRSKTFSVFRQAGNQGGGAAIQRTVQEGTGNGNGILELGEQATIWVRLAQGLDPFDKNNWCRVKVHTSSPWLNEIADIQEDKQREWTSAQSRTSLVELSSGVPPGTEIPVILDCESWGFYFTPDVRYGKEPLYQAFQFHKHHLFSWKWTHP